MGDEAGKEEQDERGGRRGDELRDARSKTS